MKKILLISKEWSSKNNTGLAIASTEHENILKSLNFQVLAVSGKKYDKDYSVDINFFLKPFSYISKCQKIIDNCNPDIIIVESLQTVISEVFLYLAYKNKIVSVLISHGISIYPYKLRVKYILRSLIWVMYVPLLIFLLKKLNHFFSLDVNSENQRHLDKKIYCKLHSGRNLYEFNNFSRFEKNSSKALLNKGRRIILCLGYVNHIKNQKYLIEISKKIQDLDVHIRIVYNFYEKKYFDELKKLIVKNHIKNIFIVHESETNVLNEIVNCWLLINTSITEVLPISLIEGNSLSKMFISFNSGSIKRLQGGVINQNIRQMIFNIRSLYFNSFFISRFENIAHKDYNNNFSKKNLVKAFSRILQF
jgi:glycosyltransferase involved in cell wall biosynthesis